MELLNKIAQSNDICASLTRIANEKVTENVEFQDHNDIHVLAKRVLSLLEEFKRGRPAGDDINARRYSSGQKQR